MQALMTLSRLIDRFVERISHLATWAVFLSAAISAGNAMIRYAFDMSSNAWLEIQWYLFTVVVMLGASYTLQRNEHVRVDLVYMQLSERGKEWLDLVGTILFVIPTMTILAYLAWPLFERAWEVQEMSSSAGGLIRWPVLLLIPVGFLLVALQGVSEIIKRAAALFGATRFETHYERPLQ